MNGYLVVLSCTMDDVPIGLFETFDEAKAAGRMLSIDSPVVKEACDLFRIDHSQEVCVKVVGFVDGRPTSVDLVQCLGEEMP